MSTKIRSVKSRGTTTKKSTHRTTTRTAGKQTRKVKTTIQPATARRVPPRARGSTTATPPSRRAKLTDRASAFEYDVCLSFAGENRPYVDRVAKYLNAHGVRVFYDLDEQTELWGKDLYTHLDEIYRNKARFCVMFISEAYGRKLWTRHERQSAQARAFRSRQEYLLPACFDDTKIPGIRDTVGYIDLKNYTPTAFAKLILAKMSAAAGGTPPSLPAARMPAQGAT